MLNKKIIVLLITAVTASVISANNNECSCSNDRCRPLTPIYDGTGRVVEGTFDTTGKAVKGTGRVAEGAVVGTGRVAGSAVEGAGRVAHEALPWNWGKD